MKNYQELKKKKSKQNKNFYLRRMKKSGKLKLMKRKKFKNQKNCGKKW